MKCPRCQSDSRVKNSRETDGGMTRRRRVCENGHRFTTWESHLNPADTLKARERSRRRVRKWRERLGADERAEKNRRYRLRRQARQEAQETGLPVETIYQQWGVA